MTSKGPWTCSNMLREWMVCWGFFGFWPPWEFDGLAQNDPQNRIVGDPQTDPLPWDLPYFVPLDGSFCRYKLLGGRGGRVSWPSRYSYWVTWGPRTSWCHIEDLSNKSPMKRWQKNKHVFSQMANNLRGWQWSYQWNHFEIQMKQEQIRSINHRNVHKRS